MGVLTSEQYKELQKNKESRKAKETSGLDDKKSEPQVSKKIEVLYKLYFPETMEGFEPKSFKAKLIIDNKEFEFECNKGMVETKNEKLANYLLKSQYILISKEELNNDL